MVITVRHCISHTSTAASRPWKGFLPCQRKSPAIKQKIPTVCRPVPARYTRPFPVKSNGVIAHHSGKPRATAGSTAGTSHRQAAARIFPGFFIFRYPAHIKADRPAQITRFVSRMRIVFPRAGIIQSSYRTSR